MSIPRRIYAMLAAFAVGLAAFTTGATAETKSTTGFTAEAIEYHIEEGPQPEPLADVMAAPASAFQRLTGSEKFGYRALGVWVRFVALNHGKEPSEYLVFDDTTANRIDLFMPTTGITMHAGSFAPLAQRDVVSRAPTFLLRIPPGESRTTYVRLESFNIVAPRFHFENARTHVEEAGTEALFLGLYYGAAFAFFLYNLFLFLSIRDRSYLLYAGFILATLATFFAFDGFADIYLSGLTVGWQRYTTGFGQLALLAAIVFSRSFLDVPRNAPRFDYLMRAVVWINVLSLIVAFSSWTVVSGYLIDSMSAVTGAVVVSAGILALLSGFRPARFYLLSWMTIFTMTLVWLGGMHGVLPRNPLTTHGILIGSVFEMIVMSLALGDRLKIMSAASEAAHKTAQEQRAIARAARMIAHDVRKPFSQLDAILTVMAAESTASDMDAIKSFARRRSEDVRAAMRFVDSLLDDVMNLGRSHDLKRAALDPAALLDTAVRSSGPLPAEVRLEMAATHLHAVDADAAKMQRVLVNLLDNARAAVGASGRIWLRVADAVGPSGKSLVRMTVGNDGPCIAAEDLPRIFEAFFTKGKDKGTGLGLAVCREIVAAHAGTLTCTSSAEHGTEFVIDLPASPLRLPSLPGKNSSDGTEQLGGFAPTPDSVAFPERCKASELRVLAVVDDCPFVRESWQVMVADAEIAPFATPADFFARFDHDALWRSRLAAVVTDFDFGHDASTNGVDLATRLADAGSKATVPVILSSDWRDLSEQEAMLFSARIEKRPIALGSLLKD